MNISEASPSAGMFAVCIQGLSWSFAVFTFKLSLTVKVLDSGTKL